MQTSTKKGTFSLSNAAIFYAKILQTSTKKGTFSLSSAAIFYAKILQTSTKKGTFNLSSAAIFYAKLAKLFDTKDYGRQKLQKLSHFKTTKVVQKQI